MPKIIAFPRDDIAYNECLYAVVKRMGIEVANGEWAGRWLFDNVHRGDLVHLHWPSFLYFDPQSRWRTYRHLVRFCTLLALLRARGARLVWTAHNLYPHEGGRNDWTHRFVRRLVIRSAEKIFVHGGAARQILQKEFGIPSTKCVEIPHGNWIEYHSHTTTKNAARRILSIPDSTYVYCIVGACRPYKNLEGLIEAFAKIEDNGFLLIAGHFQSREYKTRIENILRQLPKDRYRLEARFLPNDEVQNFVLAGDALVLPYTEILTSGSAMLGLSFGVPVIAPQIGSLADVITQECGLLYDASDSNGLLRAMLEIRRRNYSSESILQHARSYDWTESAQTLANVLRDSH